MTAVERFAIFAGALSGGGNLVRRRRLGGLDCVRGSLARLR
jgi:hypothetical protein